MPKVLLIEDDNNLREIFEMRLQAEGYDTVTAGNGEEGLTVAMREKPDLLISDVMMPKLSGFEMLETLRAAPEGKDMKVIMMTALGQAEDRARGEKLGVVKYLVKSQATLDDFAKVVREVLPPNGGQPAPADDQTNAPSLVNQQESENKMPEDPTAPTNPSAPAADNPAPTAPLPADGAMPAPAPASTNPVTTPEPALSLDGAQQSASQEQNAVDQQINNFVASTPAADIATPVADAMTPPAPALPSEPAAASEPFAPAAPPASSDTFASSLSDTSTPGAPDLSPLPDPTSTDAPSVPPATPPANTPPVVPPQTDAPAPNASATPPTDPTSNAI